MPKAKFDYFEALANVGDAACDAADMLVDVLKDFSPERVQDSLAAMHDIENTADEHNHELFLHIATEFLTPVDREDIVEIAHRLDDVVDYIEDVLQQLYMYDIRGLNANATGMAALIHKTTRALVAALREFKNFKKAKTLSERLIEVNDFEEEADKLYMASIRDLYINHTEDPVAIMAWSNVFLRMERCIDACENVADMIGTVVVKNS